MIWVMRTLFFEQIEKETQVLCRKRGLDYRIENLIDIDPVLFPRELVRLVMEICEENKIDHIKIISGAGHDCSKIASIAPAVMIFVPTKNGLSHCPEEETGWDAIDKGTKVLLETIILQSKK